MASACPCGSGAAYDACCGPLHRGAARAPTALALMRSRYSAFAVADAEYLLATWLPAARPGSLSLDPAIEWRRLRIRGLTGGAEDDTDGTVEFVAHFWDRSRDERGRLHEDSAFVRDHGRWLYVGPVRSTGPATGSPG